MDTRNTKTSFSITGRIDAQIHDEDDLREATDDYDSLSDKEKLELARTVEPEQKETVYNVTTDRLHEYFVDNLDAGQTSTEDNVDISFLGLGDDGASGTTTADTDLNNRTFTKATTDESDNGKDLLVSTFLSSSEGNGNTFDELGLFTGDPSNLANAEVFLVNHATFSSVTKDSTKTVTFDVTLTFSDV